MYAFTVLTDLSSLTTSSILMRQPIELPAQSGLLQAGPNEFDLNWRTIGFDPKGNIVTASINGCCYGKRSH